MRRDAGWPSRPGGRGTGALRIFTGPTTLRKDGPAAKANGVYVGKSVAAGPRGPPCTGDKAKFNACVFLSGAGAQDPLPGNGRGSNQVHGVTGQALGAVSWAPPNLAFGANASHLPWPGICGGAPRARQTPPGPAPSLPLTRPADFIGHAPSLKFPGHAHVVYISTFVADAPTTTAGCSGIVQKGDWKSPPVRLPYGHLKAFLPPRCHPSGV